MSVQELLTTLPTAVVAIFAGIVGLAVGSFLNVIIYRVPRAESIALPASHCPQCKTPIRPWENIPVISYIFLQGRCRTCSWPIKPRYPLVEFLGGLVAVVSVLRFGMTWDTVGGILLGWHLIALAVIDFETRTLPDQIVLPMALFGLLIAFLRGGLTYMLDPLVSAAIAAVFFTLIYMIARFVLRKKEAMGSGDVTMTIAFALYMTPMMLILTMLFSAALALMATLVWAYATQASKGSVKEAQIPFGTALAVGAWSVYMFGGPIVTGMMNLAAKLVA